MLAVHSPDVLNQAYLSTVPASEHAIAKSILFQMSQLTMIDKDLIHEVARRVIDAEKIAVDCMLNSINDDFYRAISLIEHRGVNGRVVITGMGKSGHIGKKIAATMSSTGTPAYFMHPAEGRHGDLGMITRNDVVIAISSSGETEELLGILPTLSYIDVPIIAMTSKGSSTLARHSLAWLDVSVPQEAGPLGLAPTASTTATLVLGDALAVVLQQRRGFQKEDFALYHPAGMLGKRLLLKVKDLMHSGGSLPYVTEDDPMLNALMEIGSKKLGLTLVNNAEGELVGFLSDGDIRRAIMQYPEEFHQLPVKIAMSLNPHRICQDCLAVDALREMEDNRVTALVVEDETSGEVTGLIHLHDLLNQGF
jgi:arabinose-5-phosphate isomerase